MASSPPQTRHDLSESGVTMPSDSENYEANNELSPSPPSTSSSPLILYKPPTFWSVVRGAAINLFLPFINGLMLGFGELFAHEIAFRLGWANTRVFPNYRGQSGVLSRPAGPGVEIRESPVQRRRRSGEEMDMYTNLE